MCEIEEHSDGRIRIWIALFVVFEKKRLVRGVRLNGGLERLPQVRFVRTRWISNERVDPVGLGPIGNVDIVERQDSIA
jgi:hypothetical protein